tara:strand:+ start:1204 stop:1617 length:414 start_codon:yes stop_codon:yes gene_type:complete
MSRILCFDYGTKRIGIAVTDELRIIASPLVTCDTYEIFNFVDQYISKHNIELFLVGMPLDLRGKPTDATKLTKSFISSLSKKYPNINVDTYDERFTSKIAKDSLIELGKTKKYRRNKRNIDKISASIILQSYLTRKK